MVPKESEGRTVVSLSESDVGNGGCRIDCLLSISSGGQSSREGDTPTSRPNAVRNLDLPLVETVRVSAVDDQPAVGAEVVVYVRPAYAKQNDLVELTRAVVGSDGVAILRGIPSMAARRLFDKGRADLVFIAFQDGQVALPQMVTAEYTQDAGSPSGQWKLLKVDAPLGGDGLVSTAGAQQPHFKLGPVGGVNAGGDVSVAVSAPTCYTQLTKYNTIYIGSTPTQVGHHQIAKDAIFWNSNIIYSTTKTSTRDTASSWTVGAGGLSFGKNGTRTMSSGIGVEAAGNVQGQNSTATNRKQVINTAHRYDEYRCWTSTSTPPASVGNWPVVAAVTIPGEWQNSFAQTNEDGGIQACPAGNSGLHAPGYFSRQGTSSYTLGGSFTVNATINGKSGSFTGANTVGNRTTSGERVTQVWSNTASSNKNLCGVNTANYAASSGNVGPILAMP